MYRTLRQTMIAATAIVSLSAFAAIAAPPGAGDPTAVRPAAPHVKPAEPHNMAGKIEQRITELHARLQISPAQKAQWDQFADVMRENARGTDQTFARRIEAMPTMTAPENMASYAKVAVRHGEEMQKLVPAFQALYDVMSDNQKRTADQVFRDDAHHGDHARHG